MDDGYVAVDDLIERIIDEQEAEPVPNRSDFAG